MVELLKNKAELIPQQGNVLVPGCGQGYDVFLLASPERKAYGLDWSETCIEKCLNVGTSESELLIQPTKSISIHTYLLASTRQPDSKYPGTIHL